MVNGYELAQAFGVQDGRIVIDLITQLAHFEDLDPPDADARARLLHDGCATPTPRFEVILAKDSNGSGVGYALYFFTYSTFLARPTLYLEDLFVLPDHRGKGLGKGLFLETAAVADQRGCGRMEWVCLDWNIGAQEFYDSLGASRMTEWLSYRLTDDSLSTLAQGWLSDRDQDSCESRAGTVHDL
jgi:GNAT superfamily N-acetyltransferase